MTFKGDTICKIDESSGGLLWIRKDLAPTKEEADASVRAKV